MMLDELRWQNEREQEHVRPGAAPRLNGRSRTIRALVCVALCGFGGHFGGTANAWQPRPDERIGRWWGYGWGDGYHACQASGFRSMADLPPRSFASIYGQRRPVFGGNDCASGGCSPSGGCATGPTFYDHFDAANACGCDHIGFDASSLDDDAGRYASSNTNRFGLIRPASNVDAATDHVAVPDARWTTQRWLSAVAAENQTLAEVADDDAIDGYTIMDRRDQSVRSRIASRLASSFPPESSHVAPAASDGGSAASKFASKMASAISVTDQRDAERSHRLPIIVDEPIVERPATATLQSPDVPKIRPDALPPLNPEFDLSIHVNPYAL